MAFDGVIGKDAKLYYNSGTHSSPTWNEITKAKDVNIDLGKNEAEVNSRESEWEMVGAGLKTVSVDFGYLNVPGTSDTVFQALKDAYINDTPTQFAIMDQAVGTSNSKGVRAYFIVTGMSRPEPLEGALMYNFTLRPTRFDDSGTLREPEWYEVP